jgi:hypothetical protein
MFTWVSQHGRYEDKFGKESRIQLNDAFATLDDIQPFVILEREEKDEVERKLMTSIDQSR